MRNYIKLLLIFTLALFFSCNTKQKKLSNIEKQITKPDSIKLNDISIKSDKIVGKYYINSFRNYLYFGLELKAKKPNNHYTLYTFEFNDNGIIIFNDLTEEYDCGSGILSIDKAKWLANEDGTYNLRFKGSYSLDYNFVSESEYFFKVLENGDIEMKLHKVITHDKTRFTWE